MGSGWSLGRATRTVDGCCKRVVAASDPSAPFPVLGVEPGLAGVSRSVPGLPLNWAVAAEQASPNARAIKQCPKRRETPDADEMDVGGENRVIGIVGGVRGNGRRRRHRIDGDFCLRQLLRVADSQRFYPVRGCAYLPVRRAWEPGSKSPRVRAVRAIVRGSGSCDECPCRLGQAAPACEGRPTRRCR